MAKLNTERKAAKKIDTKAQTQAKREADLSAFVTVPPAKETGSGIRGIEAATAASPIPIAPTTAPPANQTTSEVRDSSLRGSDLQLKGAITPESSSLPSKPGRRPHDATNTGQQSMVQEAAKITIESAELTRAKAGNDCGSHIGSSQQRPAEPRVMAHERRRTIFFAWQLRSNAMNALHTVANVICYMRNCNCNCAALLRVATNLIKQLHQKSTLGHLR